MKIFLNEFLFKKIFLVKNEKEEILKKIQKQKISFKNMKMVFSLLKNIINVIIYLNKLHFSFKTINDESFFYYVNIIFQFKN